MASKRTGNRRRGEEARRGRGPERDSLLQGASEAEPAPGSEAGVLHEDSYSVLLTPDYLERLVTVAGELGSLAAEFSGEHLAYCDLRSQIIQAGEKLYEEGLEVFFDFIGAHGRVVLSDKYPEITQKMMRDLRIDERQACELYLRLIGIQLSIYEKMHPFLKEHTDDHTEPFQFPDNTENQIPNSFKEDKAQWVAYCLGLVGLWSQTEFRQELIKLTGMNESSHLVAFHRYGMPDWVFESLHNNFTPPSPEALERDYEDAIADYIILKKLTLAVIHEDQKLKVDLDSLSADYKEYLRSTLERIGYHASQGLAQLLLALEARQHLIDISVNGPAEFQVRSSGKETETYFRDLLATNHPGDPLIISLYLQRKFDQLIGSGLGDETIITILKALLSGEPDQVPRHDYWRALRATNNNAGKLFQHELAPLIAIVAEQELEHIRDSWNRLNKVDNSDPSEQDEHLHAWIRDLAAAVSIRFADLKESLRKKIFLEGWQVAYRKRVALTQQIRRQLAEVISRSGPDEPESGVAFGCVADTGTVGLEETTVGVEQRATHAYEVLPFPLAGWTVNFHPEGESTEVLVIPTTSAEVFLDSLKRTMGRARASRNIKLTSIINALLRLPDFPQEVEQKKKRVKVKKTGEVYYKFPRGAGRIFYQIDRETKTITFFFYTKKANEYRGIDLEFL
ncbi:MAG: hypothetical protein N2691_05280 [Patescibacteria group bacterium]|nr:hypothetical protein [Patescibacteria group bacterium]